MNYEITNEGREIPVTIGATINNLTIILSDANSVRKIDSAIDKYFIVTAVGNGDKHYQWGIRKINSDGPNQYSVGQDFNGEIWKVEKLMIQVVGVPCNINVDFESRFQQSNENQMRSFYNLFNTIRTTFAVEGWSAGISDKTECPNNCDHALYFTMPSTQITLDVFQYLIHNNFSEIPHSGVQAHSNVIVMKY